MTKLYPRHLPKGVYILLQRHLLIQSTAVLFTTDLKACSKIFFTIFHKVTKWQNSPIIWWEYLDTKKKSNESGTTETDPRLLIRRLTQTYQISFNLCLSGLWFYKIIAIAVIPAEKMALLMVITNSFTCASGKSHTQVSTIITLLLHKRKWRQRESG